MKGGEGETVPPPVVVKILINDPESRERAEQAAAKLVEGIAHLLQKLEGANGNATVIVLDRSYRVADVLADLLNTDFTVTDRTNFNNNGVGASARGVLGQPNTDIINMDAVLGYATAGQPGLNALILHEMAHISAVGWDFFNDSVSFWNSEPADKRGQDFYAAPADYANNVEKFANDFKNAIAPVVAVDPGSNPGGWTGAIEPALIYQAHMDAWS